MKRYRIGDIVQFNWSNRVPMGFNTTTVKSLCIRYAQYLELSDTKYDSFIDRQNVDLWELCRFTHTGRVVDFNDEEVIVAEALTKGYTFVTYTKEFFNELLEDGTIIIKSPAFTVDNVKETAEQFEGTPYGVINIIQLALGTARRVIPIGRRFKLLGKGVSAFVDNYVDKALICSEANAKTDPIISKGMIDLAKEFKLNYDSVMPVHYNITKFYK